MRFGVHVDSLAEAPTGRALGPVLAPGLIVGAGVFHRLMASLGSLDPAIELTLLGALAGGLIAVQIFLWSDEVSQGFVEKTSAASIVLLAFLLAMNGLAIYLRNKFEKRW